MSAWSFVLRHSRSRRGVTALEYTLLIIMLTVVLVVQWPKFLLPPITQLGDALQNTFLPRP